MMPISLDSDKEASPADDYETNEISPRTAENDDNI
jgi:hypothetical protein